MATRRRLLLLGAACCLPPAFASLLIEGYRRRRGVYDIVEYPSPSLRRQARSVDVVDERVRQLGRRLEATLALRSVLDLVGSARLHRGLAAPQVGIDERLVVCRLATTTELLVNPRVLDKSGRSGGYESCLSLPGRPPVFVQRSAWLQLAYLDREGRSRVLEARYGEAALVEHELDHLDGVLLVDYLES